MPPDQLRLRLRPREFPFCPLEDSQGTRIHCHHLFLDIVLHHAFPRMV